ncbi:PREDICTED: uncharacterized protein LOC104781625 isoform X2 [Camelina sativa]|nr:PREDICTED: uncharacterized protein LOC104781625 isoform X2 [Camelina sativa]
MKRQNKRALGVINQNLVGSKAYPCVVNKRRGLSQRKQESCEKKKLDSLHPSISRPQEETKKLKPLLPSSSERRCPARVHLQCRPPFSETFFLKQFVNLSASADSDLASPYFSFPFLLVCYSFGSNMGRAKKARKLVVMKKLFTHKALKHYKEEVLNPNKKETSRSFRETFRVFLLGYSFLTTSLSRIRSVYIFSSLPQSSEQFLYPDWILIMVLMVSFFALVSIDGS